MNTFHLRIVTMDGKVFDDQASQIFLRTIDGDVAIRAGHINYCSGIGMGQAHVTRSSGILLSSVFKYSKLLLEKNSF